MGVRNYDVVRAMLAKWFFFSIMFGLLPLLTAYIKAISVGPSVSFKDLVARGGLLLVAAGLSAGAIGELIASGREYATLKYLAGGPCILIVVAASLVFMMASDAYTLSLRRKESLEAHLNTEFTFWFSIVVYVASVIGSLVGVWVAASESRIEKVEPVQTGEKE
jgi:hypothetical protein